MEDLQKMKLMQVRINEDNPRTITDGDFERLMNSLLVFPQMMALRPVVVDSEYIALGGNMRLQALRKIAGIGYDGIGLLLGQQKTYNEKTELQQGQIQEFWKEWFKEPFAYILIADQLTEEQKEEFIIKDNVGFGKWDWDALANNWDNTLLNEWGMNVWEDDSVKSLDELDEFFEEAQKNNTETGIKIAITIPCEESDIENDIRKRIKEALKDYPNVSIK